MVDGNDADAVGLERQVLDRALQRARRDAGKVVDAAGRDQRQARRIILDMMGKIGHEGVAADRQEEFEMRRP